MLLHSPRLDCWEVPESTSACSANGATAVAVLCSTLIQGASLRGRRISFLGWCCSSSSKRYTNECGCFPSTSQHLKVKPKLPPPPPTTTTTTTRRPWRLHKRSGTPRGETCFCVSPPSASRCALANRRQHEKEQLYYYYFFIIVLFSAFIGDAGTKAPAHQLRFRSCTVLFRVHNAYFDFDCFSGSNVQQQQ